MLIWEINFRISIFYWGSSDYFLLYFETYLVLFTFFSFSAKKYSANILRHFSKGRDLQETLQNWNIFGTIQKKWPSGIRNWIKDSLTIWSQRKHFHSIKEEDLILYFKNECNSYPYEITCYLCLNPGKKCPWNCWVNSNDVKGWGV